MIPRIIIRIENLLVVVIAAYFYYQTSDLFYLNFNRLYLIVLTWLSFDLSMAGYLLNKRIGALIYNLVHNYLLAFILIIAGMAWYKLDIFAVGLILVIHVGIDRFLGFGLKYPSNFKDTHMQKV